MAEFTADWFSAHIPVWQQHLAPLMAGSELHALEIGSFEGRSALWLLEHVLLHDASTITCVDTWDSPPVERRFCENLDRHRAKVRRLRGRSCFALRELQDERFGFVYIDGSHQLCDVLGDFVLAWPLLSPGGIVAFDDYANTDHPDVKTAVEVVLRLWQPAIDVLHQDWQVILRRR